MPPELPLELYQEIFKHLDQLKDRLALTLTSHNVRREVEYLIYNAVECDSHVTTHLICNTILSNPRIWSHIRSFSVTILSSDLPPSRDFWLVFAQALRTLHLLDVLKIDVGNGANFNSWILNGCSFSLREFACSFAMDRFFMLFLRSQSSLRVFDWHSSSEELSHCQRNFLKSPTAAPSLAELTTNSIDLVCTIVPHRPITHLWIQGMSIERWTEFVPILGLSTGPIRSLRINFPFSYSTTLQVLSSLQVHIPGLQSLGFLPTFTIHERDVIDALAKFKQLKSLVLWNVIPADASRMLAEACPSLRTIACLHYSYSHEYVCWPVNPMDRPMPMHDPDLSLWRDV